MSLPDIPSLELEPAPPPRSPSNRPPSNRPRPPAVAAPTEGPDFDDDDLGSGEPLLLDMPDAAPGPGRGPSASQSGIRLSVPPLTTMPPRASAPPRASGARSSAPPPPADEAPAAPPIVLDAVEVERVAGYGPVPSLPWETPVYAYRVWERRRVLRGLLVHARATAAERARAVDDALVATLDSLRPVLLASPESAPLLEPSAAAQARREERLRAITQLEDEASRELSEIDQEQEQAKLEIQHHRNEKDALALEAARLYEAARQGGGSEPLDEVRAQMAKHEASATGAISELAALRGRRRAREEGLQSTLAAHHADLDKIEAERRALLLEAGRAFVAGQRSLDEAGLGPVQAAGEQHRLALRQIATLEAALGGYDRARIREGVLFVVGSLATLALLLALGVLRMVAE